MILGALLAAGTGRRFAGGNKLLATIDGDPVVARAARTLTEANLDSVVAVTGRDRDRVSDALPKGVEILHNPDYERGQSASVRRVVAHARETGADAVVFALGDMPRVRVETVEKLVAAFRDGANESEIVAPRHDGRRGNPVVFGARHFDALARVEGDTGGRALLESEAVEWVDVDDPGIHRDVDTRADLREIQDESNSESEPGSGRG
ncbi:nucleotidyltransferase family protein [Halorussus amylolyticus]|uniref:nucleotidyltransferase family protein n=1 Tax=Halorussus amylolyticus TaxID=1126242 RepID=UPI001044965E|nr:nucleotidyltransferase family protein [Halorussus amylolyticus]